MRPRARRLAEAGLLAEGEEEPLLRQAEQEGLDRIFREAGFDNQIMDGWVRQEYITTKEFTPLLQNALCAQEEWMRMLATEQDTAQRPDETAEEYECRRNEAPGEVATRVISVRCLSDSTAAARCSESGSCA